MTMSRGTPLSLLALTICCTSLAAAAADPAAPASGGSAGLPPGATQGTSIPDPVTTFGTNPGALLGIGLVKTDGDFYLRTTANLDLSFGDIGLGLALPVSILVSPDDQTGCSVPPCSRDDKAYWGVIRKHDWDQPSDWFRFVRYVRYGHKRDPFYALVGQHWGSTIGHGSLVNRYNNALNLNLNKVGVALDFNTKYFGLETLTDNVISPNLLAARAYLRPFADTPVLRGWAIGVTVAADVHAPTLLGFTSPTSGIVLVDDKGMPAVAVENTQWGFGIDTEYELISSKYLRVIPYVDANRLVGGANGLHIGTMVSVLLPIPILDVSMDARLEYRIMQAGYIPEYFDQTYDLGRYSFACRIGPACGQYGYQTKSAALRTYKNDPNTGNQGYYGEVSFNFAGLVQVGGTLQDYQTDHGGSLGLFATVPKIEFVKVQGYYLRKNFDGFGDAFALDERSLLGASVAYRVFGPFYVQANYQRTWVTDPNKASITASDSVSFGVATLIPFGGGATTGAPEGATPPPPPTQ